MDKYLIKSVLGFDFKADIVDQNGEIVKKGYIKSAVPKRSCKIRSRILDKSFFTNYDEQLLAKIRDLRKYD